MRGLLVDVVIMPDARQVGEVVAELVAETVRDIPSTVLGFATGDSPLDTYTVLTKRVESGELNLSDASGFALDEYVGLDFAHPQSYHSVIERTVTNPLRMRPAAVKVPDGTAFDLGAAADRYEKMVREHGVDIQLLGIGTNGHIGFNEPGSPFASRTRVVTLSHRTRVDNARFFHNLDEVPTHALTQGLDTILHARRIVLIALGQGKADAVTAAIEGPVTVTCPASVLQLHPHATFFLDEAAASGLRDRIGR